MSARGTKSSLSMYGEDPFNKKNSIIVEEKRPSQLINISINKNIPQSKNISIISQHLQSFREKKKSESFFNVQ